MVSSVRRILAIGVGFAAFALAGCAGTGWQSGFGGEPTRPKTVFVSDFVLSSDLVVIDRGYTSRLEHKPGGLATSDRKPRTIERINDEIVASIIATLREAGLDAQPGSTDTLTLSDEAAVVSGRLRPGEPGSAGKNKKIGFGVGYGGVVAEMKVSYFSSRGNQPLLTFNADAKGAGKPLTGKQAAARNAAIAAALSTENSDRGKLSPDVEVQARRIGRAVGERVVAFAKEQGWIGGVAAGEDVRVRLPAPKPGQKPEPDEEPSS